MKKTVKNSIAVLLCLIMIFTTASISFAASVGKVKTIKIDSTTQTAVSLKWGMVPHASGYRIYSYDNENKKWVTETYTTETSYTDKKLQPGTNYSYKIKAYVKEDGERIYGATSATVNTLTKPYKVGSVVATKVTGSSVTLDWDIADGATGYIVYRKNLDTSEYERIGSTKKNTYTVNFEAAPGTTYFKVKSYAKGEGITTYSELSPTVKAVVNPEKVSAVTASEQKEASVVLAWNKCEGATDYIIYKKDLSTNGYEELARTKETSYKVEYPATPGKCYFKVKPYADNDGTILYGSTSDVVSVVMKPSKIKNFKVSNETMNSITISWTPMEGSSYYVIYQLQGKKYKVVDRVTEAEYTAVNLDYSTSYSFKIMSASEFAGKKYYSEKTDVVTGRTKFGELSGIKATVDKTNSAYLMWDETNDANGYIVEKKVDDDWKVIADVNTTMCVISDYESGGKFTSGTAYIYRVKAYMNTPTGIEYSKYTDEIVVKAAPTTPLDVKTATGSDHSIVLDWTKVEGADGYSVYFYAPEEGKWLELEETKGIEYTSAAGKQRIYYIEKDIPESGFYQYKIRSFVANNGIKTYSEFSEIVTHEYTFSSDRDPLFQGGLNTSGLVGYLYDEKYDCFYTAGDPWQRNFGFNEVYDISAQWVLLQYDTVRYKFKYRGKDWMIQPWKGQYGWILYGGEVGVYVKYSDRNIEHYDCAKDEDLLMMSMELYRYWKDTERWELGFKRPYSSYWWCTGFKPGFIKFDIPGKTSYQDDLRLDLRITMKDFEMLEAFTKSLETLKDKKYKPYKRTTNKDTTNGTTYRVDGLDVYFTFK